MTKIAAVTGASSGIGAATVAALAGEGWRVVGGARRLDRLAEVCDPVGAEAVHLDVTDPDSVAAFAERCAGASVVVNNAGGALGLEPVATLDDDHWRTMYETNVLGVARVTKALLGDLEASGDGHVVVVGSIAAWEAYAGGAGYNAAKFGVRAVCGALRAELLGRPVRVTEIDPGMVATEFSDVRFGGDHEKAEAVYAGMTPLTAADVADCIRFAVTRPSHVNIDTMIVTARDQLGTRAVHRTA
ncbi:MAG: SDR family NAD(P)-dependent oxidoreductase [Acidimicrobiia bacterium]|nr:SDR family NAD(P)-dependent oxidoreductase [Acidimicrobiia bacterium]